MIPIECIRIIVSYCRLKQRYSWSVVHREFEFQTSDWVRFARYYQTPTQTRDQVKDICQRHFRAQTRFELRRCHLWSLHMNEPLRVWTPWTTRTLCTVVEHGFKLVFRYFRFVDFIRELSVRFGLKMRCLNSMTSDGVPVFVNKRPIPMVYIKNTHRRKKIHFASAFKRFQEVRVLIALHVHQQNLYLRPRRLEFFVE
jgi:hypothetical protein